MLFCLSHVSNRKDATVRRGAQVKALAVCSSYRFLHVWKPLLLLAVDRLFASTTGLGEYSVDPWEQCRYLYDVFNELPADALPSETDVAREVHRLMLIQGAAMKELAHVGHLSWLDRPIPLRVPQLMQLQEVAAATTDTSVSELLRRFRAGLMTVFRALVQQKRIFFLGHNQPAEQVCLAVLSMPLMVCPPLTNVLERCYPYTTLNNLDYLQVDGFIAGSTNPIFESHAEWWDVLCDLDTGKVLVSATGPGGKPYGAPPPRLSEDDADFLDQITSGLEARYSEYWLRGCFHEYAWQSISQRLAQTPQRSTQVPTAESISMGLEQLRNHDKLTEKEMLWIFGNLASFVEEESRLPKLLTILPGTSPLGCLAPIATGLFHPSAAVRSLAASVIQRVDAIKDARPCIANLNSFLMNGYLLSVEGGLTGSDRI